MEIADLDILPLGMPKGGSLGVALEAPGLQDADQVQVTFVFMANAGSRISADIARAAQLPFYVEENS
jgi:hypothetical protein